MDSPELPRSPAGPRRRPRPPRSSRKAPPGCSPEAPGFETYGFPQEIQCFPEHNKSSPGIARGPPGAPSGASRGVFGGPGGSPGHSWDPWGGSRVPRDSTDASPWPPEHPPGAPRDPQGSRHGLPRVPKSHPGDPQGSPEGPKRAPETPQEPQRPPEAPPKGSPGAKGRPKDSQGRSWGGGCAQNMHILIVFRVVFVCYRARPGLTCPLGAAEAAIERFVIVILETVRNIMAPRTLLSFKRCGFQ